MIWHRLTRHDRNLCVPNGMQRYMENHSSFGCAQNHIANRTLGHFHRNYQTAKNWITQNQTNQIGLLKAKKKEKEIGSEKVVRRILFRGKSMKLA